MSVLTVTAIMPYVVFFLFTWYCKALAVPKNFFKCNFAVSAIIFLAGNLTHLVKIL
jgi:hypothetical protein